MPILLTQQHTVSVGATRLVRVDFTRDLDEGASLTGTPTVLEVTTTALTLANKKVNTSSYTKAGSGATVAVGKAVEFTAAGGADGMTYTIRVACGTDSSPAETLVYDLQLSWD